LGPCGYLLELTKNFGAGIGEEILVIYGIEYGSTHIAAGFRHATNDSIRGRNARLVVVGTEDSKLISRDEVRNLTSFRQRRVVDLPNAARHGRNGDDAQERPDRIGAVLDVREGYNARTWRVAAGRELTVKVSGLDGIDSVHRDVLGGREHRGEVAETPEGIA